MPPRASESRCARCAATIAPRASSAGRLRSGSPMDSSEPSRRTGEGGERMEDGGGEDRGGEDGGEEDGGGEDRGEEDGGEEDGGEEPSEEGESDAGESDAGESDAGESGAEAGDEGGLGDDGVSDGAAMSDDAPMIAVEEEDETFAGDVAVDADAVAGHDGEDDVMAREMDASGDVADGDPPADAADASSASPSDAPEEPVGDAEHAVDEEG